MTTRAKRYPAKSTVVHFRIQPATKAALKKAAAASGRTVSAEAEHQLHRALSDMRVGKTHAVMAMIAKTIDGLTDILDKDGKPVRAKKWWDDPHLFDQAAKLAAAAFEMLRPQGQSSPEGEEPLSERSARFAVEATLREIQTVDVSIPFGEGTEHQRWLTLLKEDLGPVADRPFIWGASAQEARRRREATRPFIDEFQTLTRKSTKTPQLMTQPEAERLRELQTQILEAVKRGEDPS
jgi:hypothetical protein